VRTAPPFQTALRPIAVGDGRRIGHPEKPALPGIPANDCSLVVRPPAVRFPIRAHPQGYGVLGIFRHIPMRVLLPL
jgi:hypothetical protein